MATCGRDEGRGHLARALAIADALAVEARASSSSCCGASWAAKRRAGRRDRPDAGRWRAVRQRRRRGPRCARRECRGDPFRPAAAGGLRRSGRVGVEAAIVVQPSQAAWRGAGAGRPGTGRLSLRPGRSGISEPPVPARTTAPPPTRRRGTPRGPGLLRWQRPCRGDRSHRRQPDPSAAWRAVIAIGAGAAEPPQTWPVAVVRDPRDLPERLAAADLAVLGAGTMKFEAACLGVPAMLLAVADDQLAVGPAFAATGSATYLGDGRTVDPGVVRTAVDALAGDPDTPRRHVTRGLAYRRRRRRRPHRRSGAVTGEGAPLTGRPAAVAAPAGRFSAPAAVPR